MPFFHPVPFIHMTDLKNIWTAAMQLENIVSIQTIRHTFRGLCICIRACCADDDGQKLKETGKILYFLRRYIYILNKLDE